MRVKSKQLSSIEKLHSEYYSTYKFGDRIGDIATVVGEYVDKEGKKYVFAVLDAKYMGKATWGVFGKNTGLPKYSSANNAKVISESATYNTDYILNNYTPTDYPAFNHCDTCALIELNRTVYKPKLPNAYELQQIFSNRDEIYALDPTASEYIDYNLAKWSFNGASHAWCSNECSSSLAWNLSFSSYWCYDKKNFLFSGVIPIFEIEI